VALWPAALFGARSPSLVELAVRLFLLGWALVGAALTWRARSGAGELLAVVAFSGIAVIGAIVSPAIALLLAQHRAALPRTRNVPRERLA
jgi:hypothetical protein